MNNYSKLFWGMQKYLNECVDFCLDVYSTENNQLLDYQVFSHIDFDGYAAMITYLTKKQDSLPRFMQVPELKAIPWYLKLLAIIQVHFTVIIRSANFLVKNFNYTKNTTQLPSCTSSLLLTEQETTKILSNCKQNNINITSYLLFCYDQALQPFLASGKRVYFVPVTFTKTKAQTIERYLGYIDLIFQKQNVSEISQQFRKKIQTGHHWAGAMALMMVQRTPNFLLKLIIFAQAKFQKRTSNFSFLGNWGSENSLIGSKTNDTFINGRPIVSQNQPLASTTLIWNNRLALNIVVHPSLSVDAKFAHSILQAWIKNLRG